MKGKANNKLRVLRAERRVTQRDVAKKTGLGETRYWRIENGYEQPTDTERAKLAKALRVEESALGFDQVMESAAS
jgi:transcriptional regulator with XRE-family HTH domain